MRLKKYLFHHVMLVLLAVALAAYGYLTTRLLPSDFVHCFMHDVILLYCPFCGGTRAFFACLLLDLGAAFRYNPAVMVAALLFLILDIRALVLILCKHEGPLFPRFCAPLAVIWFTAYTVLRNVMMLFGIDPVGDLVSHWSARLTVGVAFLASLLLGFTALLMLGALLLPRKSWRPPLWIAAGGFAVLLIGALHGRLWLLLLVPLAVALLALILSRKKEGSSS